MRSQISAVLLALVLVASPISMVAGPGVIGPASAQTGAPDGMVTIPDTNVVEDLPVGASSQLTRADLEGSVMASRDADSLQVIVTTPERASGYVNGSRVSGSGDRALVFRDNVSHSGRDVAVPADAVRETVGHVPNVVHGVHEDGTSWTAEVEARNGLLIFNIPHFSSNSVTFEGEVSIRETPAVDGSTTNYQVGDSSNTGEFQINVTGVDSTETETVSGSALSDGSTLDLQVTGTDHATDGSVTLIGSGYDRWDNSSANTVIPSTSFDPGLTGNIEPTGPENGEPRLTVTGHTTTSTLDEMDGGDGSLDGREVLYGDDGDEKISSEMELVADSGGTIDELTINADLNGLNSDYNPSVDVYIVKEAADGAYGEGTLIKSGWNPKNGNTFTASDGSVTVTDGQTYTIELVTTNAYEDGYADQGYVNHDYVGDGNIRITTTYSGGNDLESAADVSVTYERSPDVSVTDTDSGKTQTIGRLLEGETKTVSMDLSTSSAVDFANSGSGGTIDYTLEARERKASIEPGFDIDNDGNDEVSTTQTLMPGESYTESVGDIALGTTGTVSTKSGTVDVSATMTEHTVTRDPNVLVNGNETSYTGRLDPGQQASLTTDTAWINDGSNTVEVQVGDGTLSSDAPTPAVDLEYTHTASAVVDTTYTADGWEESYNVSHTFAGDRENAELRIPFSQRIYQITHVEKSVNGGSWQSVSSSNWELQNGTDLVVQLKDTDGTADVVEAGDQVAIRTAGNKFQTVNGAISITDPTTPDDDGLDTGFKVDSKSTGFRLEVGGTPLGDQVHYTHTESWEAPEDRAVLSADGSQELRLPNAQTGGSARVTTIPLEPQLDSGDVGIQVVDPDNPTLAVGPGESGSGATVQYRWHDAVPGEQYGLYSLGKERYVDKKDAGESYVQLADDDSQETLVIKQPDGSSGGGSSSGSGQIASGAWDNGEDGIDLQQIAVIAGWAVFSLLLVAATGRSSLSGRPRWILVGAVSGGLGLLALEILRPGAVSGALNQGIQEIVPLAGLAGIGIAVYSVWQWWQARREEATTPDTQVVLGGNSD